MDCKSEIAFPHPHPPTRGEGKRICGVYLAPCILHSSPRLISLNHFQSNQSRGRGDPAPTCLLPPAIPAPPFSHHFFCVSTLLSVLCIPTAFCSRTILSFPFRLLTDYDLLCVFFNNSNPHDLSVIYSILFLLASN